MVNQTRLARFKDVPTPLFELEVQRGGMPGAPGAKLVSLAMVLSILSPFDDDFDLVVQMFVEGFLKILVMRNGGVISFSYWLAPALLAAARSSTPIWK